MNKQKLRQKFLQKRKRMDPVLLQRWSQQIENYVIDFIENQHMKTIMVYASMRDEVATHGLIQRLLSKKLVVGLPKCYTGGHMEAYSITDFKELTEGRFGILEPPAKQLLKPETIELVLVPGCAFGRDMSRLGYGGGYYDRYLPRCKQAMRVGLGYQFSVTEAVPIEKFDVLMDVLITENGVINKAEKN